MIIQNQATIKDLFRTKLLWNFLSVKSQTSSGHSRHVVYHRTQTSELTLSSFQSSLYLLQRVKYLFSIPRVFCTLLDKVVTMSMMAGLDEMSVKKLNTTGSSSPSACWGGVSIHVPCIQRTNILVLWGKNTVSKEKFRRNAVQLVRNNLSQSIHGTSGQETSFKK